MMHLTRRRLCAQPLACETTLRLWHRLLDADAHSATCLAAAGCDPFGGSVTVAPSGELLFPLATTPAGANVYGSTHGGLLLSLTDVLTSLHIIHALQRPVIHVSVSLTTNFAAAMPAGADRAVVARSRVTRRGRSMVFTTIDYVDALHPGVVFAHGSHTKAIVEGKDF